MVIAVSGRRALRGGAGVLASAALIVAGAAPALAAGPEPDLGIGALAPVKGLRPGSAFTVPLSVLNKGTEEVPEVYVTYAVSPGLRADETYSNCAYVTVSSHDEQPETHLATCHIRQALEPGVVYEAEKPLSLKALDSALYDSMRVAVWPTDPGPGDAAQTEPVPGTGAPLKLAEKGAADEAGRKKHAEAGSSGGVTAENTADYALTGAELEGRVGQKVTATVKFTNRGPAWTYREPGSGAVRIDVRIPAGTSVVKAHGFCDAVTKTHYRCGTAQSWVDPEASTSYPFVLRVDKAVGTTTGKVSFGGEARPFDEVPANDTAKIVIDTGSSGGTSGGSTGTSTTGGSGSSGTGGGTGGASGGSTTGGPTSGGATSGGSTTGGSTTGGSTSASGSTTSGAAPQATGGLAATGSDSAAPLAGAAAAALAAGGGLVYAMRRRTARKK